MARIVRPTVRLITTPCEYVFSQFGRSNRRAKGSSQNTGEFPARQGEAFSLSAVEAVGLDVFFDGAGGAVAEALPDRGTLAEVGAGELNEGHLDLGSADCD